MAIHVLFLLSLLFSASISCVTCSVLHGNDTDRIALLAFKQQITSGEVLSSWNDTAHFCQWVGVSCSSSHPWRVTAIDLSNHGVMGYISPSIGNLTFLKTVKLSMNRFVGEIPPSVGRLHQLQSLDLSNNSLQGRIPEELANCSNLRDLHLHTNQLVGGIPSKLGTLSELVNLDVSENNLTSILPPSLGNITTLEFLSTQWNYLEGSIPNAFGQLSRLWFIALLMNRLSGTIPPALFNLTNLRVFWLSYNNFDRSHLPSDIGNTLYNLQKLYLSSTNLIGPIPASLSNASRLTRIAMPNNGFTGQVPTSLGKLGQLDMLNLEYNYLVADDRASWRFIDVLSNCTVLRVLSLDSNRLRGKLPDTIGNLSLSLKYLLVHINQISGPIPRSIEKFHNLIWLGLSYNRFTGTIPDGIGKLKNLQKLRLSGNKLVGQIPSSLGNLTQLVYLFLQSNKLTGAIPPTLGNLPHLMNLDLSENNLFGSIPEEIFFFPSSINLSYNSLGGALPFKVCNNNLQELYLSANKLSSELPSTFGYCEILEYIELDQNFFHGKIPPSVGNLTSIMKLNLSHNNLSGSIPESLVNLHSLELLDLSYNHLQGEVPHKGPFGNATILSLGGNVGLCGGIPELHMPACPIQPTGGRSHSLLLKIVIPTTSFIGCSILITILVFLFQNKSSRKSSVSPPFGWQHLQLSYWDLAKATNGFSSSSLLGSGRYGSVYRGTIDHAESTVAVKVFNLHIQGGHRSFMTECEALRSIRHRNLVPIVTACSSVDSRGHDFKAIVFKYMPKGDLDKFLHDIDGRASSNHLGIIQRVNIATNIADALEYLHHSCQRALVHCDLKPGNIFLDDDMSAHIGDFGLARFYVDSATISVGDSATSIGAIGTIGYVPPEYALGGQMSTSGDVYSFGIILLEMFIGKRPTDDMFKEDLSIVKLAEKNFPDNIMEIVDHHLLEEFQELDKEEQSVSNVTMHRCLISVLEIALACTRQLPNERMNSQEVAIKMNTMKKTYLGC